MSSDEGLFTHLIARVRALLPEDWDSRAGDIFRAGTQALSDFAEVSRPLAEDLLRGGIDLAHRKVTGLASQEHAAAEKNYAEAIKAVTESEDKKIEIELKKRSLEIDISRKEAEVQKVHAEVRKANAEATLTEIQALNARYELLKKLTEAGVVLVRDDNGNFALLSENLTAHSLSPDV